MEYSFLKGIWKSFKNTAIVLIPAITAGWGAFVLELPVEYQQLALPVGGFLAYLVKNWLQVKKE